MASGCRTPIARVLYPIVCVLECQDSTGPMVLNFRVTSDDRRPGAAESRARKWPLQHQQQQRRPTLAFNSSHLHRAPLYTVRPRPSPAAAPPAMAVPTRSAVNALKLVQSQIFQTVHNPDALRTGAKYLRKRLRGPAMLAYLPPRINLRKLVDAPEYAFDPPRPKRPEDTAGNAVWNKYEAELLDVRRRGNVEPGFIEVERDETLGWLADMKEVTRRKEVAERRADGRGPPKKGMCGEVGARVGSGLILGRIVSRPRPGSEVPDEEEVEGAVAPLGRAPRLRGMGETAGPSRCAPDFTCTLRTHTTTYLAARWDRRRGRTGTQAQLPTGPSLTRSQSPRSCWPGGTCSHAHRR